MHWSHCAKTTCQKSKNEIWLYYTVQMGLDLTLEDMKLLCFCDLAPISIQQLPFTQSCHVLQRDKNSVFLLLFSYISK